MEIDGGGALPPTEEDKKAPEIDEIRKKTSLFSDPYYEVSFEGNRDDIDAFLTADGFTVEADGVSFDASSGLSSFGNDDVNAYSTAENGYSIMALLQLRPESMDQLYHVTVTADGYEPLEFTIGANRKEAQSKEALPDPVLPEEALPVESQEGLNETPVNDAEAEEVPDAGADTVENESISDAANGGQDDPEGDTIDVGKDEITDDAPDPDQEAEPAEDTDEAGKDETAEDTDEAGKDETVDDTADTGQDDTAQEEAAEDTAEPDENGTADEMITATEILQ